MNQVCQEKLSEWRSLHFLVNSVCRKCWALSVLWSKTLSDQRSYSRHKHCSLICFYKVIQSTASWKKLQLFQLLQTAPVICENKWVLDWRSNWKRLGFYDVSCYFPFLCLVCFQNFCFFLSTSLQCKQAKRKCTIEKKESNCKLSMKKVCRKGRLVLGLEITSSVDM